MPEDCVNADYVRLKYHDTSLMITSAAIWWISKNEWPINHFQYLPKVMNPILPTFPENLMQIHLEVFAQLLTDKHTNNDY